MENRSRFPQLDVAQLTDVGKKRRKNEDFPRFALPQAGNRAEEERGALFVVADGMGGLGGGDVASQGAIDKIFEVYYERSTEPPPPDERLANALEAANVYVRRLAEQTGLQRIGTTAAGLLLLPDSQAVVFSVGDARVYRIRDSKIEALTQDQSILAQQLASGLISETEARQARNMNVTVFIGQPKPLTPFFDEMTYQDGDIFVICSDGLWDLMTPAEIRANTRRFPAEEAVKKLVQLALKRGGTDNIAVIVARVGQPPAGRRRRSFWSVIALLLLLLIAGGAFLALSGDADEEAESDESANQAAIEETSLTQTLTLTIPVTATRTPRHSPTITTQSQAEIEVIATNTLIQTITPSPTPSTLMTDMPTTTPTATSTSSLTLTQTPSPTFTATASVTPTSSPTDTLAPPTATQTATSSQTPTVDEEAILAQQTGEASTFQTATATRWTATASPSPTVMPSLTSSSIPTVTLDPTALLLLTPQSQTPTQTPTPLAVDIPEDLAAILPPDNLPITFWDFAEPFVIVSQSNARLRLSEEEQMTDRLLSEDTLLLVIGYVRNGRPGQRNQPLYWVNTLNHNSDNDIDIGEAGWMACADINFWAAKPPEFNENSTIELFCPMVRTDQ
jgi:protein phosphatase